MIGEREEEKDTQKHRHCTMMAFYLMEAQEVLNGRGCVEDVTLCRHHHYKPVQSLERKKMGREG